jgi:hypothetical protein
MILRARGAPKSLVVIVQVASSFRHAMMSGLTCHAKRSLARDEGSSIAGVTGTVRFGSPHDANATLGASRSEPFGSSPAGDEHQTVAHLIR